MAGTSRNVELDESKYGILESWRPRLTRKLVYYIGCRFCSVAMIDDSMRWYFGFQP